MFSLFLKNIIGIYNLSWKAVYRKWTMYTLLKYGIKNVYVSTNTEIVYIACVLEKIKKKVRAVLRNWMCYDERTKWNKKYILFYYFTRKYTSNYDSY